MRLVNAYFSLYGEKTGSKSRVLTPRFFLYNKDQVVTSRILPIINNSMHHFIRPKISRFPVNTFSEKTTQICPNAWDSQDTVRYILSVHVAFHLNLISRNKLFWLDNRHFEVHHSKSLTIQ